MKVGLLYGTETGNAEMLCDDIEEELGSGFECEINDLGDIEPEELNEDTFYIIVTSTYGNGDLPTTAAPFYDKLTEEKPDLSNVRFAIFGLGDMVFDETYNQGSERLRKLLVECGAKMIGERGLHDASSGEPPEDLALPWVQNIVAQLSVEAA
ncbi:MAG: flavodoxin domain-containing protein [Pseudomonadota bacterium]